MPTVKLATGTIVATSRFRATWIVRESGTCMVQTPCVFRKLPRVVAKQRVAAVRRLANRDTRNPADKLVSRAQPP